MDFTGHDPQVELVPRCKLCKRWLEPILGGPVDGPSHAHRMTSDDRQRAYVARENVKRDQRAADAPAYQGEPTKCQARRWVSLGRSGDWLPCRQKATRLRDDDGTQRPVCGTHARVDVVVWSR